MDPNTALYRNEIMQVHIVLGIMLIAQTVRISEMNPRSQLGDPSLHGTKANNVHATNQLVC
jgi:hypothetical protein